MLDPMDVRQRRKRGSESENLALRIVNLSERRQQIIRPVLANPRKVVLLRVWDEQDGYRDARRLGWEIGDVTTCPRCAVKHIILQ